MSQRLFLPLLLVALCALPAKLFCQNAGDYARVKVFTSSVPGGLLQLGAAGIAVDHGEVKQGHWFVGDLSAAEITKLQGLGYELEILIPDVSAYYVAQNRSDAPRSGALRELCEPVPTVPVPQNFSLGSMGGYYTWQEMQDILDAMHAAYPELISAKASIGESYEGRPIFYVRMSNNPTVDQDKPEVFYNALHHAREPASLSQVILFMWHLLENYGSDAEATYLLDNMELYFVPCVNPDGYVFNETNAPDGGGMWRKNRRDNGDGTFGVDLNRNYGQGWGFDNSGSSPDPASEVYRGTAAFSEPEIQVIRDFCESREFRLTLNYHTYGNLLIYPWGYIPSFYTQDSALFVNYGQLLTRDNGYVYGTADQTVNYVTNGSSDDWMYGEQSTKEKIFAMTPEAGEASDGFWPPEARITDICLVNVSQNLHLAHLSGTLAVAQDLSPSTLPLGGGFIPFQLKRLGLEPGELIVSLSVLDGDGTTGPSRTFTAMELLEERTDSIAFTLSNSPLDGDVVRFELTVDNGLFVYRDTLTKTVGTLTTLIADDGSTLSNWQGTWGLSSTTWFSPSSSITDSPFGTYSNNANRQITLVQAIDLSNVTSATLSFMAKWDIEPSYDHVQVLASGDNGITWTALCGNYTKSGSEYQEPGEPIFDGQQTAWVLEEMSLDAFIGGSVRIRFQLRSDFYENGDGFYFDDLRVITTGSTGTGIIDQSGAPSVISVQPNPASDHTLVRYSLPTGVQSASLVLLNAMGQVAQQVRVEGRSTSIVLRTAELAPGTYTCVLQTSEGMAGHARLVVARR